MEQVLKELPGNIVTGSAEKEAYMCMLDTLTHNPEANEKYGSRLLKKLSENLERTSDLEERAHSLEIMVRILGDTFEDALHNEYRVSDLYRQYVKLLSDGYMDRETVSETLELFAYLEIEPDRIVNDLVNIFGETFTVRILSNHMSYIVRNLTGSDEILNRILVYKKRMKRFDAVLQFHLMMTAEYAENMDIAGEYLKKYSNYSLVCADWIFSSRTSNIHYVKEGILSEREYEIFVKAGDVLENCRKIKKSGESYEDLIQDLKTISERFKEKLKDGLGEELLQRFYNGKGFFQTACTLPKTGS